MTEIKICSFILTFCTLAASLLGLTAALAETQADVSLTLPASLQGYAWRLSDKDPDTRITVPKGAEIGCCPEPGTEALLICWYDLPEQVTVCQKDLNGNELQKMQVSSVYETQILLEKDCAEVVLHADAGFGVCDILPQSREEAETFLPLEDCEKADLMLVMARPSDESLYFQGILPLFAGNRQLKVKVVYMSAFSRQQIQETLSVLRMCGVTTQPVFLGNQYLKLDKEHAKAAPGVWGKVRNYEDLVTLIRRYKPDVLLTHGENAENEDAMQALTYRYVFDAADFAKRNNKYRPSARQYGLWEVREFYSLSEQGEFFPDTAETIKNSPDQSCLGRMDDCLKQYATLSIYRLSAPTENPLFRLETCAEGEPSFLKKGSRPEGTDAYTAQEETESSEKAQETEAKTDGYFLQPGEPEHILSDYDSGRWEYISDTLSVLIDKKQGVNSENGQIVYFVAHIRMRDTDAYRSGFGDITENGFGRDQPWKIARRYGAVLAITGDNLINSGVTKKGILIRNGRLFWKSKGKVATLGIRKDMTMEIYPAGTDANVLLEDGVMDTYGFGPTLVENGTVNPETATHRLKGKNPRTGIGMVEQGHYVAIVVDGRQKGYSLGVSLEDFADLFAREGCTLAYNMDGGVSSGMVFMGEHINQHRSASGGNDSRQRPWPDALLFGYSKQVPGVKDKVTYTGNKDETLINLEEKQDQDAWDEEFD